MDGHLVLYGPGHQLSEFDEKLLRSSVGKLIGFSADCGSVTEMVADSADTRFIALLCARSPGGAVACLLPFLLACLLDCSLARSLACLLARATASFSWSIYKYSSKY